MPVSATAAAQSDAELKIAALTATVQALNEQLDHARRMATLGELTGTTTHEFNNLLMTILNYAKLGLRHQDQASRDKALQRIHDAATKASRLTGSILALARNRSGALEPTCLKQVIEDTVLLLEREFRRYRVQLELQLEEVPDIMGQGNEIQRVLINVLTNARQATTEGGWVRVTLKQPTSSGEVWLTVRDSGSGIPAEVLPKIFDPFFSTKAGPDASGKGGSGLGLAACKQIVEAHGGKIRVETKVGTGTAFIIRLPIPQLAG
ncbi:MAG: HAMP domain-containing histidine kinase [Pirellulaceae bacterium]|nr:HAMP domain-containing histidine kinase [Pirellulaceae bacterium]